ncbi:MAG: O-antigen ligase family protein, partial [Eubacteriales bacterium]|nr:O-antigen ligase family protein [Eubacteriales bacterium]
MRGLFFEQEQRIYLTAVSVILAVMAVKNLLNLKSDRRRSFTETRISLIDIFSLCIVAAYMIASFIPADPFGAVFEFLKYAMLFGLFLIVSSNFNDIKKIKALLWTITASAAVVCVLGIDSVSGSHLVAAIENLVAGTGSEYRIIDPHYGIPVRISSTLQYPNSLAGYLLCIIPAAAYLSIASRHKAARIAAIALQTLLLITFVFTFSRGAYIVFPLMILIALIFLPVRYKGAVVLSALSSGIPAVILSYKLSVYFTQIASSAPGGGAERALILRVWSLVLLCMLAASVIWFFADFIIKFFAKAKPVYYIAGLLVIAVAAVSAFLIVFYKDEPLSLGGLQNENRTTTISRSVVLEPGRNYYLSYKSDIFLLPGAASFTDESKIFKIDISSKDDNQILLGGSTQVITRTEGTEPVIEIDGTGADNDGHRWLSFEVPYESKIITLTFTLIDKNAGITLADCRMTDPEGILKDQRIILKHKYLSEGIAKRINDINASNSEYARMEFYKDGLKIFMDRPLTGWGGNAWEVL